MKFALRENINVESFSDGEMVVYDQETERIHMNEQELDWSQARSSLELFAVNHSLDITDLCPIFRK